MYSFTDIKPYIAGTAAMYRMAAGSAIIFNWDPCVCNFALLFKRGLFEGIEKEYTLESDIAKKHMTIVSTRMLVSTVGEDIRCSDAARIVEKRTK